MTKLIPDYAHLTTLIMCDNEVEFAFVKCIFTDKANSFGIIREGDIPKLNFRIKVSDICQYNVILKVAEQKFLDELIEFLNKELQK